MLRPTRSSCVGQPAGEGRRSALTMSRVMPFLMAAGPLDIAYESSGRKPTFRRARIGLLPCKLAPAAKPPPPIDIYWTPSVREAHSAEERSGRAGAASLGGLLAMSLKPRQTRREDQEGRDGFQAARLHLREGSCAEVARDETRGRPARLSGVPWGDSGQARRQDLGAVRCRPFHSVQAIQWSRCHPHRSDDRCRRTGLAPGRRTRRTSVPQMVVARASSVNPYLP